MRQTRVDDRTLLLEGLHAPTCRFSGCQARAPFMEGRIGSMFLVYSTRHRCWESDNLSSETEIVLGEKEEFDLFVL